MDNKINKFLLAGDKFMPEMLLRQPRFAYSACGSFTKNHTHVKVGYTSEFLLGT